MVHVFRKRTLPGSVVIVGTLAAATHAHEADPNKRGHWNELPITLACASSTPEVVDLLLASGASLRNYCLHAAAKRNEEKFQPQALAVLSHLLDLGMDINEMSDMGLTAGRGHGFFTPLHAAAAADSILLLLKRGANPDIRSTLGELPLDLSVRRGNEAAIRALKENAT